MEEWQEWQIRADQIAKDLGSEVDALETQTTTPPGQDFNFRAFWPRFRDLKERVRTAPAIRLEAKLDLERRLRTVGARAYKAQEGAYARSAERKTEILGRIAELRATAEQETSPRALRALRKDFDRLREEFDQGTALVPPDRQAVWDAWREANQFAWQRLVDIWGENENELRAILSGARDQIERGNAQAARQAVGRFFDTLKSREAKQESVNQMKQAVDRIRQEAEQVEERAMSARAPQHQVPAVPAVETWRSDLARNREVAARLADEVAILERRMQDADSILEQAMVRGSLVEKRQKLSELERSNRTLEQRIEQTKDSPLIPAG
jgi:hypothetical protein